MLAGLAAAIVDYRVTLSRVPPVPALCPTITERCEAARDARLVDRYERSLDLESDFRQRSWFYALGVLGGVLGLAAVSLRKRRAPSERQEVFANLGVGGVALGLVVAGLFWLSETGTIQPGALPAFVPSGVMLALAAFGGITAFAASGKPLDAGGHRRRLVSKASLAGLGLTAVTGVLAWVATEHIQTCSNDNAAVEYFFWAAAATAIGAGVFGLLGLLVRRWFVALVCFVVNPVLLLAFLFSCLEL
jgi:hypothetical protein